MRILTLNLTAFGHFTGQVLEFPSVPSLCVVFGLNEAGKSTTLRAVQGLLYGIPDRTEDNFLHDSPKLRIGAVLTGHGGKKIDIVRRKGRKETLAGPDGAAVPESVLRDLLGGVDEETFRNVYIMGRDELVLGGRALAEGRGVVGESLFAAGLGGADLKGFLATLEAEADALFRPRGSEPRINKAAHEFAAKKVLVKDAALKFKDWRELDRTVAALDENLRAIKERVTSLSAEKSRLERLQVAIPAANELKLYRARRDALGTVTVLREGFAKERVEAQLLLSRSVSDREAVVGKIREATMTISGFPVPESLLAQDATVQAMRETLGSIVKARQDLPKVTGQVAETLRSARTLLTELKPGLTIEDAAILKLPLKRRETIQALVDEYNILSQRITTEALREEEQKDVLHDVNLSLAGLSVSTDVSALERTLALVQRKGDLCATRDSAQFDVYDATQTAGEMLKELRPFWDGNLEASASLVVPISKTVEEFDAAFQAVRREVEKVRELIAEAKTRAEDVDSEVEKLRLSGEPPTEDDLLASRVRRESGWRLVRGRLQGKPREEEAEKDFDPLLPLDEAYEKSVESADTVSDRMRKEATEVAKKAALLAGEKLYAERIARFSTELTRLEGSRESLEREWAARWVPAGITPRSPNEMREFLNAHANLLRQVAEVRRLEERNRHASGEVDAARGDLVADLVDAGRPAPEERTSLDEVIVVAQTAVSEVKSLAARRERLEEDIEAARKALVKAGKNRIRAEAEKSEWMKKWDAAVAGFDDSLEPRVAKAFLEKCRDLAEKLEKASNDQARVDGMARDIKKFEETVSGFVARLAVDLASIPPEQAVRELASRVATAKTDRASREQVKKQLDRLNKDLEAADASIRSATAKLAALRKESGCETDDQLVEAETRSDEARTLNAKSEELEGRLVASSAGKRLDEFVEEAAGMDPDQVKSEVERVAGDHEAAVNEAGSVGTELGLARGELRVMDGRPAAAITAQEAQETLSEARNCTERYLRLRIAIRVLRAEIERYKEKSQGPVLKRASEVFSAVTLGRYAGLAPDYDAGDEPVLVGVKPSPDGGKVHVEKMSTGTRDQAYLALRLASLEKFVAEGEPLPLLVDDALISFDDSRAEAAIKALGELAMKTQVILFTHHGHMVDIARRTLPEEKVCVLTL